MEHWQKVESLFRSALEQPPAERGAWLRKSCGSDPDLLREIDSLISNHIEDDDPGDWAALAAAQLIAASAAAPGQQIGHYKLLELIGAGGMGEVYRARDTNLDREVAIKLLPLVFAKDAARLARFTREAQMLASLNHPNIAALYEVEKGALVMELVDGPTLAEYVAAKHPGSDEVLSMMRQVAEALEYAHERRIVHRDLKPSNIRLTHEGRVKVLDFGLAKALVSGDTDSPAPSPTISAMTGDVVIGTPAYMSPEQTQGIAADKRADVWSFGVVLYELLSGRKAFDAATVPETLTAVLKSDPDWSALPPDTAPSVHRLLRRCLERDRRRRLRDMGDVIIEIDEALARVAEQTGNSGRRINRGWRQHSGLYLATLGLLAVGLLVATLLLQRVSRPAERPLIRVNVDLGSEVLTGTSTTLIISRDGRRIVFPARAADGQQRLATRLLDEAQPTLLTGTDNASDPFFSPDGEWIGFFAEGKLKKISVHGGAPVVLCSTVTPRGASWGEDHTIVAALSFASPLSRLPDTGGRPKSFTKLRPGETTHRWPQVLPGGDAILFTASSSPIGHDDADIEVLSLKTGQVKVPLHGGYFGRYLPSGHLLYVHQGVLFGVRFDAARLEVRGTPTPLMENAAANPITGGQFDFSAGPSESGVFMFLAGTSAAHQWRVDWLDASRNVQPLIAAPGVYTVPRLSPDGKKLAFIGLDSTPQIYDLQRETTTRITSAAGTGNLVWAPDSQHLVFGSGGDLFWIRSDGVGGPQRLLQTRSFTAAWSFSPDGHRLACFAPRSDSRSDIWIVPLNTADPEHPKAAQPLLFVRTAGNLRFPQFSPDGHWIAYNSDESGNDEIWVRPFPSGTTSRYQISDGHGMYPLWSSSRRELFYETTDHRIMVVDYNAEGDVFRPGKPRPWSDRPIFYPGVSNLDIAPDGKRFAVLALAEPTGTDKSSVHVTMLLNYFDELRRRIP